MQDMQQIYEVYDLDEIELNQIDEYEITEKIVVVISVNMTPDMIKQIQDHIEKSTGIRPPMLPIGEIMFPAVFLDKDTDQDISVIHDRDELLRLRDIIGECLLETQEV